MRPFSDQFIAPAAGAFLGPALLLALALLMPRTAFGADATGPKAGDVYRVQVKTADGAPLPRVTVVCIDPTTNAIVNGTTVTGGNARVRTDAEGYFTYAWVDTNLAVLVVTDSGFGLAQTRDFYDSPSLVVRPWGRIEGTRLNNGKPLANQPVRYGLVGRFLVSPNVSQCVFFANNQTVTDANGRFTFNHVPPAAVSLSGGQLHPSSAFQFLQLVDVAPGGTNRVEITTRGRTVTGRLTLPPGITNHFNLAGLQATLQPDLDIKSATHWPDVPAKFDTAGRRTDWWRNWHQSAAGQLCDDVYSRLYGAEIHPDGTFEADLVQPGKYWLSGDYMEGVNLVVSLSEHVEITLNASNTSDKPFDLGTLALRPGVNLTLGTTAPDFTAPVLDGAGTFKLSDYHGKFVLLEFWATWSSPSIADLHYLETAYEQYRTNTNLVMVSLSLDNDREAPRKVVQAEKVPWTQVFLGDWSRDTVTPSYGIRSIPQLVLIDPTGRIIGGPHAQQINQALSSVLKH